MSSATETAVARPGPGSVFGTGASDGMSRPVSSIVPDGGAAASAGSATQPRATGIQVCGEAPPPTRAGASFDGERGDDPVALGAVVQPARDEDLLLRVVAAGRGHHLVCDGSREEFAGLQDRDERFEFFGGGRDGDFGLRRAAELPLAQQHKHPGNDDRKHEACDPAGLKGSFQHPLTVLRPRVEQRNGTDGVGQPGPCVATESTRKGLPQS